MPNIKRYNLSLTESIHSELQNLAEEQNTTILELITKFIKLGLFIARIQKSQTVTFIVRDGENEKEIILF